jgi:glutamine synthetase
VDGAANPYLTFTVLGAAGLDGIDRGLDPGDPNTANLYALTPAEVAARGLVSLPPTLLHAADAVVADDVVRTALGQTRGGDYVDYYAEIKRDEFLRYHATISPWELDTYLTLV